VRSFDWLECELCGMTSHDVHFGLACFATDGRFERIARCTDHQACRARVEESGRGWPLLETSRG
jgi:hypothetical protein